MPDPEHPDLICLRTGIVFEWEPEPHGGGEPGYANSEDHDWAWPREGLETQHHLVELDTLDAAEITRLRDLRDAEPGE